MMAHPELCYLRNLSGQITVDDGGPSQQPSSHLMREIREGLEHLTSKLIRMLNPILRSGNMNL